ncbi:MAG: sigma-70 family RNA polymerase sigma factor [Bacteroidota bacterium]
MLDPAQKRITFERLLVSNQQRIRRICRYYADTKTDEEDLYQEIALQIWDSLDRFAGEAKLETYLYRIALNTGMTHLRKTKRRAQPIDPTALPEKTEMPPFEETLSQQERITWLNNAIKTLKPIDQTLLLLFLEEKSYEEMADVTGLSVANVGARLSRARQRLSKLAQQIIS